MSYPPRFVRERYGLTQAQFAAWIGVPVETWREWELGSIRPDPAVNPLLTLLAREPEAARRSLGSAA
ncbi:Helix-turn-helix domain-containing protein [Methylobacterium sp. 174MFSha1.1]|uniref:helix-turn-helix domain-containing protein n=1 Tax=Methylobacterium sp. 174MFSha1.1 TaxID=1502749 RepID=UPI0008E4147B|nr:helix-turn-helix domain-containing protein [Methylobacterium sp. 174MFSha1.1]SFU39538.1 Helix-turn-helix domain-containing protein [Methylobacterium sp. 174MFSha1.1]